MNTQEAPVLSTEQKMEKMSRTAQKMAVMFAFVLLTTGGILSVKSQWVRGFDPTNTIVPASDTQYYATAVNNLFCGILYTITAIGFYAVRPWALRLNILSCVCYAVGTLVVEIIEIDKGNVTESFADVIFWSTLPIIQLTLTLIAGGRARAAAGVSPLDEGHAVKP